MVTNIRPSIFYYPRFGVSRLYLEPCGMSTFKTGPAGACLPGGKTSEGKQSIPMAGAGGRAAQRSSGSKRCNLRSRHASNTMLQCTALFGVAVNAQSPDIRRVVSARSTVQSGPLLPYMLLCSHFTHLDSVDV